MTLDPKKLDLEAKHWLARAIAGMVLADGEINPGETTRLKEALNLLEDEEESRYLVERVKNLIMPELEKIRLDKQLAFSILKNLAGVATADGVLDESESEFLELASEKLGFPEEIAERLIEMARKTGSELIEARMEWKQHSTKVRFLNLTKSGCLITGNVSLPLDTSVILRILDRHPQEGQGSSVNFAPLSAKVVSAKERTKSPGTHALKLDFSEKLTLNHGVLHHLYPDHYENGARKSLKCTSPFLRSHHLECRICGNREVVAWERTKEAPPQSSNLFGVPVYMAGDAQDHDINFALLKVSICPSCLFATPFHHYFYSPGSAVHPLELMGTRQFQTKWVSSIPNRKRQVSFDFEWLGKEGRTPEQGRLGWELALLTHEQLMEHGHESTTEQIWEVLVCQLEIAELLSQQDQHRTGNGILQRVIVRLSEALHNFTGETQIRAAYLLAILQLHEEEEQKFESSLKALSALKLSDQDEMIGKIPDALRELDANRKLYFKTRRKNYIPHESWTSVLDLYQSLF